MRPLATAEFQWQEHLGPLLGWQGVVELLPSVNNRQAVNDLAHRGRLLSLRTKNGQLLYPLF